MPAVTTSMSIPWSEVCQTELLRFAAAVGKGRPFQLCSGQCSAEFAREFSTALASFRLLGLFTVSVRSSQDAATRSIAESVEVRSAVSKRLQHSLRLLDAMDDIADACEKFRLRYCFIKGLGLSHMLYGDLHVRSCSDIDILIPEEDAVVLHQELLASGFLHELMIASSTEPSLHADVPPVKKAPRRLLCNYVKPHESKRISVELHISAPSEHNSFVDDLRSDRMPQSKLTCLKWNVPCRLTLFLLYILDKHKDLSHGGFDLRSLVDLYRYAALVSEHHEWPILWEFAARHHCVEETRCVLHVLSKLISDAPVDPEIVLPTSGGCSFVPSGGCSFVPSLMSVMAGDHHVLHVERCAMRLKNMNRPQPVLHSFVPDARLLCETSIDLTERAFRLSISFLLDSMRVCRGGLYLDIKLFDFGKDGHCRHRTITVISDGPERIIRSRTDFGEVGDGEAMNVTAAVMRNGSRVFFEVSWLPNLVDVRAASHPPFVDLVLSVENYRRSSAPFAFTRLHLCAVEDLPLNPSFRFHLVSSNR